MRRAIGKLIFLSLFLCISTAWAGDIRIKVDESGRAIYYNIPSNPIASAPIGIYYSDQAENYLNIIQEVCARHQVDADLVKAMIQVESNYNSRAVSRRGAMGLMQLMPETAARYGVRQIFDPWENVEGGVRYLKDLLQLFNSDLRLAIAAYNAGENVVQRINGVPNYIETQDYVRKVLALYKGEYAYTSYSGGKPRLVTYYKYVDDKGITHYEGAPVPGAAKISFYY